MNTLSKLSIFLIAGLLSMIQLPIQAQSPVKTLKAKACYKKLQNTEDILVIDVRPQKKYALNRIENAVPAESVDELRQLLQDRPVDQSILIYCQKGDRSRKAREVFRDFHFHKVYELHKGLNTWLKAGLPLDTTRLEPLPEKHGLHQNSD